MKGDSKWVLRDQRYVLRLAVVTGKVARVLVGASPKEVAMHSPKVVESVEKSTIESLTAMMSWKRLTIRP